MANIFKKNQWESDFFNQHVFNLEQCHLSKSSEIAFSELPIESLICCKIAPSNYLECDQISSLGFTLVEGEVVFKKKLVSHQHEKMFEKVDSEYYAKNDDLKDLLKHSEGLYSHSRFREPWFTTKQKDRFYTKWLENAVLGLFDDCCLLIKISNKIAGFITLKLHLNSVSIGLIGVFSPFQGIGLGSQLLKLAESYALENGKYEVTVATQLANSAALKLYSSNNYLISNTAYWFYKQV
tara:strand:- start:6465 stop:7178 length:714 start_codon:yes stop_codon:yes gene_type:complete